MAHRLPVAQRAARRGTIPQTGGDGSTITMENGTTFIYRNSFGGIWVQDPEKPFSNDAQPNSWTPPLSQKWRWGVDRANGVNLGGLFVIEPFITPHFFQQYPGTKDEFTLSEAMAADTANGGLDQLERHYDTFITEYDIAQIAGAGLNFIRIPLGFWAIETYDGENYLERTSWKYFLRVLGWARKYGLRVFLDIHAFPGSQNGLNHSGRLGSVNFLAGNMGIANAERALYYLRIFTQFISQPEYKDLILILGIVNEPGVDTIGMESITSFNLKAHDMIRSITGYGDGNGPYIAIGDGFRPLADWGGHLAGADRMILDKHPYFAFEDGLTMPIAVVGDDGIMGGPWPRMACAAWSAALNISKRAFGVTINGEMSAAPNDCGLFMRAVGVDSFNPQCGEYNAWETYNATMKEGLMNFVSATFDALGDWWFWTWKIGPSSAGRVETPLWSYSLGLEHGWIPKDPRTIRGFCGRLGINNDPFDGNYQPWQTGAVTSTIAAASSQRFPWPPTAIANAEVPVTLLPTYTNTAPVITMPPATFTGAPASVTQGVDGWANNADTAGGVGPVNGCQYPYQYDANFTSVPIPTAPCTGS
ncbi:glycoside hydrolase family 5 protein [Panaeolus papilionaceus]|nr:glycoside hydrolase family 5 protein [Panaeolus papilionaceus]